MGSIKFSSEYRNYESSLLEYALHISQLVLQLENDSDHGSVLATLHKQEEFPSSSKGGYQKYISCFWRMGWEKRKGIRSALR